MLEPWVSEYFLPILGAVIAGGLIGLEREYRGHAAGFRTHVLLSMTSALLMLAAGRQTHWLGDIPITAISIDPARMAHGILTGIGFLCGGVIFRQGLSVHGLTTAASLWVTAGLGVLFGVGLYGLAIAGVVATLIILVILRLGAALLPQQHHLEVIVRYRRGESPVETDFSDLVADLHQRPEAMGYRLLEGGEAIELFTTLRGPARGVAAALTRKLCDDQRVLSFDVTPRNI